MLSVIMPRGIMLHVYCAEYHNEVYYAECHHAECRYAELQLC